MFIIICKFGWWFIKYLYIVIEKLFGNLVRFSKLILRNRGNESLGIIIIKFLILGGGWRI